MNQNQQRKPEYDLVKRRIEYVENCKKLVNGKTEPDEKELDCPLCAQGKGILLKGHLVFNDDAGKWQGDKWHYYCKNCGESFSTNESDTISLASLKQVEP